MLDPIVAAAGVGVLVSPIAGKALVHALASLTEPGRRRTSWLLVGAMVVVAVAGELWPEGSVRVSTFVLLLGLLPGTVAFVVWRTAVASAVVSLVPLYFGIGTMTLGRPLHRPEVALDVALPLQPAWVLVYGSLFVFVLLPLLVVREQRLFRRALQAYVLVLTVAYLGFVVFPTVAPRPAEVPGGGFAAWCLRLQYSLDWQYNCFPSLHVAHSFVSALACYRVHKGVGLAAALWASLIGLSALFTKQHYVVDVIAGAIMGFAAYVLFLRGHPHDAVPARDRRLAPLRATGVVGIYAAVVAVLRVLYVTGAAVP